MTWLTGDGEVGRDRLHMRRWPGRPRHQAARRQGSRRRQGGLATVELFRW